MQTTAQFRLLFLFMDCIVRLMIIVGLMIVRRMNLLSVWVLLHVHSSIVRIQMIGMVVIGGIRFILATFTFCLVVLPLHPTVTFIERFKNSFDRYSRL